jgi:hypothetical protein
MSVDDLVTGNNDANINKNVNDVKGLFLLIIFTYSC